MPSSRIGSPHLSKVRRIARSNTLREASRNGLEVRLYGANLRVTGLEDLPRDRAEMWRRRFKAEKEALHAELGGKEDMAGPILRRCGVEAVYCGTSVIAARLLEEILADADRWPDRWVGLDIEVMALQGEIARREQALKRLKQFRGRAKGLKAVGKHDKAEAEAEEAKVLALEAEHAKDATFDPYRSQIRLIQVYGGSRRCAVIDMTRVAWEVLTPLWSRRLVAHNAAYELKFLAMEGIEPGRIDCTMQAAGLLMGWKRRGLKTVAAEYLDLTVSKKEQKSDWSAPHPSQPQINYAALDAVLALKLADVLFPALGRIRPAYEIQVGVLPAIARMELRGFGFNRAAHDALLTGLRSDWLRLQAAYEKACEGIGRPDLRGKIPTTPKPKQALLRALLTREELASWPVTEGSGELATDRADLRRALHYPPIAVVAEAGVVDKQLSAFGASLAVAGRAGDGRIRASYNCGATNSGRASCSGPNLQQIPRDKRFRKLFEAAPGHTLIEIDYRAMELRTIAHISGDFTLTQTFRNAGDPHTDLAIAMSGIRPEDVSAEEFDKLRTAAKAVNFGMSYGMGPSGLIRSAWANYGVVLSEAEAQRRIATFAARYPSVVEWRGQHANLCRERGYIRIGRDFARDVGRVHQFIWNKPGEQNFKFTQSCNLPIQGACADCAMLALTLVDRMLREAGIEGGPVAWLHDAIILEVPDDDVERASSLLTEAMIEAFSRTFPGAPLNDLVAIKTGRTWGA